ncbi:channel protein TolC [Rhodoplanes roseus]|uniref:Channel protein TolC n=2 Tax=Rhodoplanes roseus TaxID=29409 RepID=A0A327L857_9BRAD|nr:channel protein TolC [Rhodoplanes roseus]
MMFRRRVAAAAFAAAMGGTAVPAVADTLPGALAQAYQNNPQLNSQRAIVRATDENVPTALSGYRPSVSATAQVGQQYTKYDGRSGGAHYSVEDSFTQRSVGITGTQTLFNGFQTGNRVRQAEGQVSAARETLRLIEQNVLLNAATAYMNLLRDTAILDLQRRNVEVLQEQLRQTRDRFAVGEVTRTDVAQSESRLAAGRSQVSQAESNYTASKATYRQVIGVEPGKLAAATPVDRLSPRTLPGAIDSGRAQNPNVTAAMFGIDVQALQVKINEGTLLPTLTAQASVQRSWAVSPTVDNQLNASLVGQLSVPIYQGGANYAQIRSAKETLGQKRLDLETARDQAQSNVSQAWGQLDAAKAQIEATQAQVSAAEIALNGVREEARVGQRTTLDVLNAQQELVNARVALVTAQRDRVVASYTLLSSVGRLSPVVLGLPTGIYDPVTHYHQVRDTWGGVRTPDGR